MFPSFFKTAEEFAARRLGSAPPTDDGDSSRADGGAMGSAMGASNANAPASMDWVSESSD